MRSSYLLCLVALTIASCLTQLATVAAGDRAEKPNEIAQFYGFSRVELFKVEPRAFNLQAGDFTGDGLTDIIVIDNRSSCLRLLAQRSQPDQKRIPKSSGKVNDLLSDWRFDIRVDFCR